MVRALQISQLVGGAHQGVGADPSLPKNYLSVIELDINSLINEGFQKVIRKSKCMRLLDQSVEFPAQSK